MSLTLARRQLLQAGLAARLGGAARTVRPEDTLTLASPDGIALRLECVRGQAVRLRSLRNQATGFEWCVPSAPFSPAIRMAPGLGTDFALAGTRQSKENDGITVSLGFEPQGGIAAELSARLFARFGALEFQAAFRNTGAGGIAGLTTCGPFSLVLRKDLGPLQFDCVRRDPYSVERLPVGRELVLTGGDWNSPQHAGLLFLEAAKSGEFLVLGIEAERCWKLTLTAGEQGPALRLELDGLGHNMPAGERFSVPAVLLMTVQGNLDTAVNAAQRHFKANVYPPALTNAPWVVYNIWGTEAEGVERAIYDEVAIARDLGVELFYVDAAWYKGSSKRGTGDWGCGLGSYEEDREKFPQGLAELSRYVHGCGMRFGLWVGPNIVDSRLVGKAIPERWIARWHGEDRVQNIPSWEATATQVCLGCPEYVDHLKASLDRIVRKFALDWLKWDNSGIPGIPGRCNRSDHGHQAGDGSWAALEGEYSVFADLARRHPRLSIEQCGYGSRHDTGLARTVRAHWMSDATYPSEHVRRNALVGRILYPCSYSGSWIVRGDPELEKAADPAALDTIFRSRMIGLFGFGTLEGKLSERVSLYRPEVLAAARRNISLYKRYRHLLGGDSFGLFPATGSPERWQAIQFRSEDGRESAVLCFRAGSSQDTMRIPVVVQDAAGSYTVESANSGQFARVPGGELRENGWIVSLPRPEMSEVLLLTRDSG